MRHIMRLVLVAMGPDHCFRTSAGLVVCSCAKRRVNRQCPFFDIRALADACRRTAIFSKLHPDIASTSE
jgi:hypothetical protein